jgi:uncharacterized protein YhaN
MYLSQLSLLTTKYFSLFTQEKYNGVDINPGSTPKIHYQNSRVFTPSSLSTGAKDQLYLAFRLAISDLLFSSFKLPLILDDSFVNFDPVRLNIAKETILQIIPDRQVILLSYDPVYRQWADHIIEIDH